MKQNKKIAVTGGIGSGKSTAMKMIKEHGFAVFSCDEVYADLVKDKRFLKKLCDIFGDVVTPEGKLDRKKLATIVFSDKNALEKLNAFTHPEIYRELFWRAENESGTCFFEVPLLFEDGAQDKFDCVLIIERDNDKRIDGVIIRDNLSREEVIKRINNQLNYDNNDFAKYYVIHNNGDLQQLQKEIDHFLLTKGLI